MNPWIKQRKTLLLRDRERLRRERVLVNVSAGIMLALLLAGLIISLGILSGCAETDERVAVPHVIARDATGRFVTPICPVCGGDPVTQWTSWRCPQEHVFATKDEPLPPVKPTIKP